MFIQNNAEFFWNNIKLEMRREVRIKNQKESVLVSFPFSPDLDLGFIFPDSYSITNMKKTGKYQSAILRFPLRVDFYPNTLAFPWI